jgi:hypothetical protein
MSITGRGESGFDQLVAEVVHVDERQRVRGGVERGEGGAQFAETVGTEVREHQQAIHAQRAAPFGEHAVRLRMPVQRQVRPDQVERVRAEGQLSEVAADQVDAGLGRQQAAEEGARRLAAAAGFASMAGAESRPSTWAAGYTFCSAAMSAPAPQPASSTWRGAVLTSARRSNMRPAISRRRKSDWTIRAGSSNIWRTRIRSMGALNLEEAWGETMVTAGQMG